MILPQYYVFLLHLHVLLLLTTPMAQNLAGDVAQGAGSLTLKGDLPWKPHVALADFHQPSHVSAGFIVPKHNPGKPGVDGLLSLW